MPNQRRTLVTPSHAPRNAPQSERLVEILVAVGSRSSCPLPALMPPFFAAGGRLTLNHSLPCFLRELTASESAYYVYRTGVWRWIVFCGIYAAVNHDLNGNSIFGQANLEYVEDFLLSVCGEDCSGGPCWRFRGACDNQQTPDP